jgi:hypothetical protein
MTDIVYCPPNVDCPCYAKLVSEITALRAEIERLRAALNGVLWMAEDWYQYGGDETTFANDHKKALDEATAALAEEAPCPSS